MTNVIKKIYKNWTEYDIYATAWAAWAGDVTWPSSSTNGHLAVFDWTTGKLIKDWWAVPTVPTKTSQLTNDSGYLTSSTWVTSFNGSRWAVTYTAPVTSVNGNTWAVTVTVPTKVSDLTNDSGFLTAETVVSWDSGTTYTIKVSNSDPTSWTPATTITFVP